MPDPGSGSALDRLFGTPTPTAGKSSSSDEPVRNQREKYLIAQSPSVLATLLKQGQTDIEELRRILPESKLAQVMDNPVTAAEMAKSYNVPKRDIDSFENPALAAKGISTVSGEPTGQNAAGAPPTLAGGGGSGGATSTSSRASGGTGSGGSSLSAAAAPPPPVPNSAVDLLNRGAQRVGSNYTMQGQQYRPGVAPVQAEDGTWHLYNPDGTINPTSFKSETAARLANPYRDAGPAITSRSGVSPAAKIAGSGGAYNTLDNPLFDTFSLDEMIRDSATKGLDGGDILGTVVRGGKPNTDLVAGGIPEYGGLTLATPGDVAMTQGGFTGQLPGNVSYGTSSVNNAGQGNYWLSQSLGVPQSMIDSMKLTPQQMLQLDAYQQTARANGTLPNFAKLYAENEPAGFQGGVNNLKWGSQNGGASNTPFDRAWNPFIEQALGEPDLSYFPENDVAPGTNGGHQQDFWWLDDPSLMADGGRLTTQGPLAMVDMSTGQTQAIAGEAGPERITVEPMNRRAGAKGGSWSKPKMMAGGGQVYAGVGKGFGSVNSNPLYNEDGSITNEGARLGYKSQPYSDYGGGTFDRDQRIDFNAPATSGSGQPVNASFEFMDAEAKNLFSKGPGQAVGAQPIGYRVVGNMRYPVYAPLNEQPGPLDSIGNFNLVGAPNITKVPKYTEFNNAGTPAFIQGWDYQGVPAATPLDVQKQQSAAFLMAMLNGGNTGNMAPGILGFQGMPDSTNRSAILAKLYELDPSAWANAISSGAAGQNGQNGQGGGNWRSSRDIQNEAYRQRYYGVDARNRARAGMDPATILNIPRVSNWTGEGDAPYQRFTGTVPEGYVLPFDYQDNAGYRPGSPWFNGDNSMGGGFGGGWGRGGGMGGGQGGWPGNGPHTPEPWGGSQYPWENNPNWRLGGWRRPQRQMQGAAA